MIFEVFSSITLLLISYAFLISPSLIYAFLIFSNRLCSFSSSNYLNLSSAFLDFSSISYFFFIELSSAFYLLMFCLFSNINLDSPSFYILRIFFYSACYFNCYSFYSISYNLLSYCSLYYSSHSALCCLLCNSFFYFSCSIICFLSNDFALSFS